MKKILTIISLLSICSTAHAANYLPNGRPVQIQDVLGCDHPPSWWSAADMGDIVYQDGSETLSAHIGIYGVDIYRDRLEQEDKDSVIRLCEIMKNIANGIPGQGQKVLLLTQPYKVQNSTRKHVKGIVILSTGEVVMINRATPIDHD